MATAHQGKALNCDLLSIGIECSVYYVYCVFRSCAILSYIGSLLLIRLALDALQSPEQCFLGVSKPTASTATACEANA